MPKNRPHFIGVGPEKTGTSWLDALLRQHPHVYTPPIKELRYFFEQEYYPGETARDRLNPDGDWHTLQYREYRRQRLAVYRSRPWRLLRDPKRVWFDWRFLYGKRTDQWYRSMFSLAEHQIAGEISPQYFFGIPSERLPDVAERFPRTRAIVQLRDPIAWSWSFARMAVMRDTGRTYDQVPESDLTAFFEERLAFDFTRAYNAWIDSFGSNRVHLILFWRIAEEPHAVWREVSEYLGVAPDAVPELDTLITRRVNPGGDADIPPRWSRWLAERWSSQIDRIVNRLGTPAARWGDWCRARLRGRD